MLCYVSLQRTRWLQDASNDFLLPPMLQFETILANLTLSTDLDEKVDFK